MEKIEAEQTIVRLWQDRPLREPGPLEGLSFYQWLCDAHPHVMDFRSSGDRWQTVSGWLRKHGLV